MPLPSDLPRLAVGVIATAVIAYRLWPRVSAMTRSGDDSRVGMVVPATSLMAFVGILWIAICLALRIHGRLLWPGITMAFTASLACLTLLVVTGVRKLRDRKVHPGGPRSGDRSLDHVPVQLTGSRLALAMVTILATSGMAGALELNARLLRAPLALLGGGALMALVVLEFRRGWSEKTD